LATLESGVFRVGDKSTRIDIEQLALLQRSVRVEWPENSPIPLAYTLGLVVDHLSVRNNSMFARQSYTCCVPETVSDPRMDVITTSKMPGIRTDFHMFKGNKAVTRP